MVQKYGNSVQYLRRFNDDKEIMTAAITHSKPVSLEFASTALKNDRELVMGAVKSLGTQLSHASQELRNDREVVLAAIYSDAGAFKYASRELRNDREIVLAAIHGKEAALEYASEELRNDREVVLAAISSKGEALAYASKELRQNKSFLFECITRNERTRDYINRSPYRLSYEECEEAIKMNPKVVFHVAVKYKEDRSLAKLAVREDGQLMLDDRRPSWWDGSHILKKTAAKHAQHKQGQKLCRHGRAYPVRDSKRRKREGARPTAD